jgi:hypothetical protein
MLKRKKTNKGKKYEKKVTLYPLTDEQALLGLLRTKPIKQEAKKKKSA